MLTNQARKRNTPNKVTHDAFIKERSVKSRRKRDPAAMAKVEKPISKGVKRNQTRREACRYGIRRGWAGGGLVQKVPREKKQRGGVERPERGKKGETQKIQIEEDTCDIWRKKGDYPAMTNYSFRCEKYKLGGRVDRLKEREDDKLVLRHLRFC